MGNHFHLQVEMIPESGFTDFGIIGSKEFVTENYQRLKHIVDSKHEKKPKPIKGLDGIYSLMRRSEAK
jgi:hypothetical protein